MNAWGWHPPAGPVFGVGGEVLECAQSLRLLLATDSEEIARSLQHLLAVRGHDLLITGSTAEALSAFQKSSPDVVLLDETVCPPENPELPRRMRESLRANRWVPALLLATMPPEPERCVDWGIDDWLAKPIEPRQLLTRINLLGVGLALQRRLLEMHRFQTLFDHVLEGIIATDTQGIVETFNPAAERIFGYRAEEVVGRNVSMLMPLPDAHRHDAYMGRYVATGEPTVMGRGRDIYGKRKDGTLVPLFISLTEMEWLGRKHFVAVVEDISERKRQEHLLARTMKELEAYQERVEQEYETTRALVDCMIKRGHPDDPLLEWKLLPAEAFSGDVVLSARSPEGRLFVFVADAMGHGLAAAVSLLPVVDIFYAMVNKGFPPAEIVKEMNARLGTALPTGRFLAAALFAVDPASRTLEVWNGGMPSQLIITPDGASHILHGKHVALGILKPEQFDAATEIFTWQPGSFLVAFSDGILEATSRSGEAFGFHRLREAAAAAPGQSPFAAILTALEKHLAGKTPHDDISLAVIHLP
mgnify:CR=1 FL=1